MVNFCNSVDMSFLIVGVLTIWGFFMVFLGLYNLVSNIIKKRYIKGVIMEIDERIDVCENRIQLKLNERDDMDIFIDDLWAELDELKELRGVYDD